VGIALFYHVRFYGKDLAYIHDAGFRAYAMNAAPGVLAILRRHGIRDGLVVDLGCGSGRWARELNRAGYDVVGIDRSPAFLEMARRIAPRSRFVVGSLWKARLPQCDAVTCIGECVNYESADMDLARLFVRVHNALRPGGVFVFDAAGPGRTGGKTWMEGRGWAVLVDRCAKGTTLVRHIVTYRRVRGTYRRSEETHRVRLYRPEEVMKALHSAGLDASQVTAFGRFRLPEGIAGFVARKP
jgi:SAM-dependent methyltransferase